MRVVLLGPPGAGKGTQAARIATAEGLPHIATGDIFRANVRGATPLGQAAQAHMERGELVPDEIVIGMVTARICHDDAAAGFLLDGFPRTVAQALALEAFLAEQQQPLDVALRFSVAEQCLVERIVERRSCPADGSVYHLRFAPPAVEGRCDRCGTELIQRKDDKEAVVRRRLAEYHEKTAPLEAFYADRSLLVDVDADAEVDAVTRRTLDVFDRLRGVDGLAVEQVMDLTAAEETVPG